VGDIWPYGPPRYVTWAQANAVAKQAGFSAANADVITAIGVAEGGLDLSVINDTPATGDYSVGTYQINYYGSLYASRVAAFGTPKQLIDGGIDAQIHAALVLWRQSGFRPWSTFNSGAYKQYLHGAVTPTGPAPGIQTPVNTAISPPTEDYSATVHAGGDSVHNLGIGFQAAATVLSRLGG
jgi:hypothetical protein